MNDNDEDADNNNNNNLKREEKIEKSDRLINCLKEIRRLAGQKLAAYKLHVWTFNNFPTAAGLASSASGLSCFG